MRILNLLLPAVAGLAAGYAGSVLAHEPTPVRALPAHTRSERDRAGPDRLDRIESELARLRGSLQRLADRPAAVEPARLPSGPGPAAAETDLDAMADFDALRRKVFTSRATPDESRRFWEQARKSSLLPDLIREMRERVKENPEDTAARMELAQACVARLYSVPNGPERGLWAASAEQQWREVLKRDDAHWEARFSLAMSLSQWPDFMNKTPDAIREFALLRKAQDTQAPAPHHVQTYLQLARLHRKQGRADEAADVLRAGLARHPDHAGLRKALAE